MRRIRHLLWLYFILILLEGALRKWIFAGFSDILLVVRDPIALIALVIGWRFLLLRPWWVWVQSLIMISIVAFILAMTIGHGDLVTTLYGLRILVLHLPLIFLYPIVFKSSDVLAFARFIGLVTIPMTILIVVQSYLPPDHFLNQAPGGEGSAVFQGALDRFRPPGTFSFTSGISSFFTLASAAVAILLFCSPLTLYSRLASPFLLSSLVVALPVSISRSLLAGYLQVIVCLLSASLLARSKLVPLLVSLLILFSSITIGVRIPVFRATANAFVARWDAAAGISASNDTRQGSALTQFQGRVLQPLVRPFQNPDQYPFLGRGLGISTNVGSQRLIGQRIFLVDEDSWPATIGELGLPLGYSFLLWRIFLATWLTRLSIRSAIQGNRLPMILLGASFLPLLSGQLSQPTNLGFIVFSAGLTIAAADIRRNPS